MQPGFWWRGWGMVALGGMMDFVATGFFFYSYSVFFPLVVAEFDLNRSVTSLGMSLFLTVVALSSVVVARMLMRYVFKYVFAMGAVLMAVGLALISQAQMPYLLLVGVIITAAGTAALGQIGPPRLVFNWFVRNRGIAMGIVAVGISLSGVVMPPVATWLIGWIGWRETILLYAGCAALVVAPLILLTTIQRPEDVGLSPDGNPNQAPMMPPISHLRRSYVQLMLVNRSVWLLALLFGAQFCVISAVLTHLVPLAMDAGQDSATAGILITVTAAVAVIGKIVIGGASDRIAIHLLLLLSIGLQALGVGLFFLWPVDIWLFVAACSFGMGFGGAVPLQNQLFARCFGSSMAMAMGISRPMMLPVQILGPPIAGLVYDLTGSYTQAVWLLLSMLGLAALLAMLSPQILRHQRELTRAGGSK